MKNSVLLVVTIFSTSLFGMYSDAEKISLLYEKLAFIDAQKEGMGWANLKNKCIYKQAQDIAGYILKDNFSTVKQQIKSAMEQIIATQEFTDYHHYNVMLKTPLIGRDHIRIKDLPIVRPDHAFAKKINEILAATVPVALLERLEILTYFEAYLNYKMDLIDSQSIAAKLQILEKEIRSMLATLEN